MSSKRQDLGSWAEASAAIGLDHPMMLRAPGIRKLAEEAHRLHEIRRAAHNRIGELEQLLTLAQDQLDESTINGLDVLQKIQEGLVEQSEAMKWTLRGMYGVLPALCFLAGTFLLARFGLNEAEHATIRAELDRRRAEPE